MRKFISVSAIITATITSSFASEQGIASYYNNPCYGGLIAAHRTLPFGSRIKVINLDNGRSATLKIVDRGPFIRGRIIDVSTTAADALGFRRSGIAHVRIETSEGQPPFYKSGVL
jgi:rare lipoprotein A